MSCTHIHTHTHTLTRTCTHTHMHTRIPAIDVHLLCADSSQARQPDARGHCAAPGQRPHCRTQGLCRRTATKCHSRRRQQVLFSFRSGKLSDFCPQFLFKPSLCLSVSLCLCCFSVPAELKMVCLVCLQLSVCVSFSCLNLPG